MLELCDGVDVLIHDAQHTHEEYGPKRHWGHCTVEYAVHVARESGARKLVLFHHDPAHDDDALDLIARNAQEYAARSNAPEVVAAYEGLELALAPAVPRAR
jgi:ribonuclease BN (tRNA processing enzyme)